MKQHPGIILAVLIAGGMGAFSALATAQDQAAPPDPSAVQNPSAVQDPATVQEQTVPSDQAAPPDSSTAQNPSAAQSQAATPDQASAPAVYTADQATAGAAVYAQSCAVCHGPALEGLAAPALKGDTFREMAAAQQLSADSLLTVTALTMPQTNPGMLPPEEYNQVVAYVLQQNGYPAGDTPLAPDAPHLKELLLK